MYYYSFHPPYFLVILGLFVAVTSGAAFGGTLKLNLQEWQRSITENPEARLSTKSSIFPFLGIGIGIGLFLCAGLRIFGFSALLACAVGLPTALLTCWLVWKQLGSMLAYAESKGGIESLDLDSLF
ncbi:MAG: hypothetical protein AAFX80_14630 [Cyanobacteria bacterium J06639_18]